MKTRKLDHKTLIENIFSKMKIVGMVKYLHGSKSGCPSK